MSSYDILLMKLSWCSTWKVKIDNKAIRVKKIMKTSLNNAKPEKRLDKFESCDLKIKTYINCSNVSCTKNKENIYTGFIIIRGLYQYRRYKKC